MGVPAEANDFFSGINHIPATYQEAVEAAMRAQAGQRTEQNKTPPKDKGFVIDGEYEVVPDKKELPKLEDK